MEAVDPFYPGLGHLESLKLFSKAMKIDPPSFLQRAICYDRRKRLSFSVSLGYVVQVFPYIVLPRDLERSELTYVAWNELGGRNEFDFDTRESIQSLCKQPILFFLEDTWQNSSVTIGSYRRAGGTDEFKRKVLCFPRSRPLPYVKQIHVLGYPLSNKWHLVCNCIYVFPAFVFPLIVRFIMICFFHRFQGVYAQESVNQMMRFSLL